MNLAPDLSITNSPKVRALEMNFNKRLGHFYEVLRFLEHSCQQADFLLPKLNILTNH